MSLIVNCPLPAALTPIPGVTCNFNFDQIVKSAFQRRQPAAPGPFTTLAAIQTLANWTTFKAAVDSTKVVTTPIFTNTEIPPSEPLTQGGNDNTTFAGIREYNGEGSVTATAQFKGLPPAVKRAMDLLSQESLASAVGVSNLTWYPINWVGILFAENPVDGAGASTTIYRGIPVYNFRVSSPGGGQLNSKNITNVSWDLAPNWADYIAAIKPAFDPLTEI
jgi:hypothetical protein